jgi:hypothetical protein
MGVEVAQAARDKEDASAQKIRRRAALCDVS